ncbi:5-bromo-4-chloroindolyl phosphate hydrolysis family protein [Peribacillus simplex]|uniref:Phosphatase n=1 Tax=Peribacillus simplex TaxID=1478 RepID=A0AAN2PDG3_9BACI|nr:MULTISPECIES: 5-bromo-4-chloroindolyl phosphate hydrolysis family protein [Bacillaceae]MCP1095083.1 5-bromo-4-chloroindolyl phosphate hydrolysis family protein [Bacillaceae bacterium OS4b]MBD8588142.1 5-bromo-4-chloroindolyl phosphate hydrolysis family protein [Peribacillus simplex]MCF7620618.1 5-bromo-4-chloroindolyl phosphate hydrolysis family protein [Peribacillus frigoritolerans]MCP1151275.1 5-bromo-4-chloroindolyl phosphate hydrolysis family protein [Peribacillus frigoritolerans]MCT138
MNRFLADFVPILIAFPMVLPVWMVSYFVLNQPFALSVVISLAGGGLAYWLSSVYFSSRYLKKHELTRKEYQYIKKNLIEAKPKIWRVQKALISVRHISSFKQRKEMIKMIRKIYSLTKKEPKRFYQAEQFYYSHLDSAMELAEKYVFLAQQPKKNRELELSLTETRKTLKELTNTIEKDLYKVIADDIDNLNFELDVAKQSIKTRKESQVIDESRRLK